MDNLQKSELIIAKILDAVASNGLQPMSLALSDLETDDLGPFFETSVHWLLDEGIMRVEQLISTLDRDSIELLNPVISAYGFSLMNQEFVFEGESETVGSAVKKVASGEGDWSNVGGFFGALLAAFTKNIGS